MRSHGWLPSFFPASADFSGALARLRPHSLGLLAVFAAFFLSLPGANWGKYECWNYDQMGHLSLQENGLPQHYLKPPLHTYLNQVLLLPPTSFLLEKVFRIRPSVQHGWKLLASRLLTISMFAASVWFLYTSALRSCNETQAGALALLYATSAGILSFDRFLTADTPLLFWMTASFLAALKASESRSTAWAVASGLLAGLATANKYNGLWACAALPATLFASLGWRCVFSRPFWAGTVAMPTGFIIGNPGTVLDWQRFFEDFYYNLITTPAYDGDTTSHGYLRFFAQLPDLIGWPSSLLLALALLTTTLLFLRKQLPKHAAALLFASLMVFLLYYLSIGKFPRMATRFVLPSLPFLFLLATPALALLQKKSTALAAAFCLLLAYNCLSCIDVGLRFLGDPRMDAYEWIKANVPQTATIENSYAPNWRRIPGYRPKIERMPTVTGRAQLFTNLFKEDTLLTSVLSRHETPEGAAAVFTPEALAARNPDAIAFSSQVFEWTGDDSVQQFYQRLDREELGYQKGYEKTARKKLPWTYPTSVDFIAQRMIVLVRKPSTQTENPL